MMHKSRYGLYSRSVMDLMCGHKLAAHHFVSNVFPVDRQGVVLHEGGKRQRSKQEAITKEGKIKLGTGEKKNKPSGIRTVK